MSDGPRGAALREEQCSLLTKSAMRPLRAQFYWPVGLVEPFMATQLLAGTQNCPMAFGNCRGKRIAFLG